ncbi:hypothetical protein GCM10007094_02860 [Pseudovibrio japonicus]|uniref:Uncharacterized protein n=1 Tax=Pseudovibrio japonicus TaxID=366534 RepID=A0ABQ3DWM0_9HYPH|nr:hypothetical protein [Pseudovibrio japonicus]GHB18530.1 hypothetical protein GCM10007094_02860 [Pseudovibrio japonicus]
MLGDQLNFSAAEEMEARKPDVSARASGRFSGDLISVLRGGEQCWCSVAGLAQDALLDQAGPSLQNVCGISAIIAINATADRVSRDLKGLSLGLSVSGLPSIQRVAYAGAYT